MTKKRQLFTYWLLPAAILLLQTGCSGLSGTKQAEKPAPVAKKSAAKKQTQKRPSVAKKSDKRGLDGEILYYLLSADVASQRGQVGLAAALYTRAAVLTRDPRIAQKATRAAYFARDNKRALTAARLWTELEPQSLEARQVLAALLVRAGKLHEAARHFEYVLNHNKAEQQKNFMLITSLLSKEKDKQAAMAVMKELIANRRDNPEALYAYSQLAFLLGKQKVALTSINKVLAMKPEWTRAYMLKSNILMRMKSRAQALAMLRQSVDAQPDNNQLRMFYARNLVDARQYEAAIKQFSQLTDDEKYQHDARFALGLLTLQLNKPQQAITYFKQLLEDNRKAAESWYYLGQSYELMNQPDKALDAYQRVEHPQYGFEAELRIALLLAKKGELQQARQRLQNLSPDSAERELRIFLTEGEMLTNAGKYREAFSLYTEALKTLPDNNRLLYARSLVAEKVGRLDTGIRDLESVVKREPENAQALNALGYTLVNKTSQIKRGFELIKKAYRMEPKDPAIQDSMGWAYYRMGNYQQALKYLRMAFKQLKDAEIAAHLGEVLWVAGDREAAQEVWRAALEQAPNDVLLLNVIQKFSE